MARNVLALYNVIELANYNSRWRMNRLLFLNVNGCSDFVGEKELSNGALASFRIFILSSSI